MNTPLRTFRVIAAVSKDVEESLDELWEVIQELNRQAAAENLEVSIEAAQALESENPQFFHRESPVSIIERIRLGHNPDVIIGVFHRRFGAAKQEPNVDAESELAQVVERWSQPDHPRVLLYFLKNSVAPGSEEERIQQDYFSRFRGFEPLRGFWRFYKKNSPLRKAPHEEELRVQARNHLWQLIKPPELNLENTGWQHVSAKYLAEFRSVLAEGAKLNKEEALDYFDGKDPTWRVAVSASVRPRKIVESLVAQISGAVNTGVLRVTLLTGPGGEGKSTILHQVAVNLAENYPGLHVIWRRGEAHSLDAQVVEQLLKNKGHFVIIADNAETIADDIYEKVYSLRGRPNSNIQFLLASRGTDWQWRQGTNFSKWFKALGERNFIHLPVQRLEEEDAKRIVEAWAEVGAEGLGNLSEEPEDERPQILFRRAQEVRAGVSLRSEEGSFFGAILRTRKSKTLNAFVQGILDRLREHTAPGGRTLEEIFAYIATPHADNLYILCKPILRHLLSCSSDELYRGVIEPLADEAASDAGEWFVLARHRMVAEKAKELLKAKYPEQKMYSDLLRAAIQKIKAKDGELPQKDSEQWNKLARSLLELKRGDLAIHLAETAAEMEPDDPYPVVAWASILRKLKQSAKAAGVFAKRYDKVKEKKNRAYFFEWGVAQREIENYCSAIWLCGISLSDWAMVNEWHPKPVPLMMRFAELSFSLEELHRKVADPASALHNPEEAQTFLYACAAATKLGLDRKAQENMPPNYEWEKSEQGLEKSKQYAISKGVADIEFGGTINLIRLAVVSAWRLREQYEGNISQADGNELPDSLPGAETLTFRKLSASLGINAARQSEAPLPNFTRPI